MPTRSGPMVQLCERHAALHASHLQAALAQCAEKTGAVEAWEEWRRATEAGWEDLAAAQFEAVGRTSSLRVSKMPSKGELVGYSLEELAGADEAVGGVPLVAHLLMERISAGQVGVAQDAAEGGAGGAQRMVAADGIFRISGEADEVHALGDALHAADAAAALAVARQTDPYVLAACLKQFYRRLARPLFPESKYQALLQARRSAARMLGLAASFLRALSLRLTHLGAMARQLEFIEAPPRRQPALLVELQALQHRPLSLRKGPCSEFQRCGWSCRYCHT